MGVWDYNSFSTASNFAAFLTKTSRIRVEEKVEEGDEEDEEEGDEEEY